MGNSQFQILAPDGTFLESWGEQGKGDGQLELRVGPEDDGYGIVAFAPDGSFFVLDGGNFRVQHFGGRPLVHRGLGRISRRPGNLPVADGSRGRFGRNSLQGGRRCSSRRPALRCGRGTLLGAFDVVDAPGSPRETAGLAIGPDGLLYVMTQNNSMADGTILVYEPDGTLARTIGDDVFQRQSVRIAFDADGHIYATEFDDLVEPNGRVHIFKADGTLLHSNDIGGYPYGIAIGADGSVIVSQYVDGTVSAFSIPVE